MTDSQREILLHTLGLDMTPKSPRPHRNYYNSVPGEDAWDDVHALIGMSYLGRGKEATGGSTYFHATAKGVQAAVGLRIPMAEIEAWMRDGVWPRKGRKGAIL